MRNSKMTNRHKGYSGATWTSKKRSPMQKTARLDADAWKELRLRVLERDNYTCVHCGMTRQQARERGIWLEVDHIIRVADGGTNAPINLQTLCSICHGRRLNHKHMR